MNTVPPSDRIPPLVPTWFAVASIAGFWLFYYIVNTVRMALADMPQQLAAGGNRAIVSLVGMVLTALLWQLLRRRERDSTERLVTLVFVACVPISLLYGAVNLAVFDVLAPIPEIMEEKVKERHERDHPQWEVLTIAATWYFFLVTWGTLYIAMAYAARAQAAERAAATARAEAQTAQLRALRYQVNPHFLFNTLNALSAQVMAGRAEEAEAMILNLSTFFRSSLATDPDADVPLVDEIALQRLYLDIEQFRFPKRLRVEIDVPGSLEQTPLPALILQPLVENAIKHGVARSRDPVTIRIAAHVRDHYLILTVADDARPVGVPPQGNGVGMANVRARLTARFGNRARCEALPRTQGGFEVVLEIPLAEHAA